MSRKTAFVTGATGFLGLNLVEQLTRASWDVVALHRRTSILSDLDKFPVERVVGDLTDCSSLSRAIPESVDAVFHAAADTSMWSRNNARQTRTNVDGTANVLAAARRAKARRFVHTSTWNTYGLEQGEINETSPQRGGASWINYDRTKFLAEELVRDTVKSGLDAVIINPCYIMGRYDRNGWARLIIDLCTRWIPAAPPGAGTFCHAQEAAKAHIAAVERGKTGQNYLLSGDFASLHEVLRTVGAIAKCRVPKRTLSAAVFRLAAHVNVMLASVTGREPQLTPEGAALVCATANVVSTRAEQELGYRPTPLQTAIRDSYDWLRNQGILRR